MKKLITCIVILAVTIGLLIAGTTRADAMNNESAALLTAGIVLLGIPVLHALSHGGYSAEPAYAYSGPPRYVEKTKIIYVQPEYRKHRRHKAGAYERGYRREWKRQQYREGARDARRDYRWGRRYEY